MRKIFTLSLAALSVGSLIAQPVATKFNGAEKNFTDLRVQTAPDRSTAKMMTLQQEAPRALTPVLSVSPAKKPAASKIAFYDLGSTLEMGIFFSVGNSGAGWYSYNTPYLAAQAYETQLVSDPDNTWTSNSGVSLDEDVEDGVLSYALPSGGGYYAPIVSNGFESYFFGKIGTPAAQYAVIWSAPADEEPLAIGKHNSCDADGFYGGVNGDYAYGSQTTNWKSDQVIIDYGTMHGFVLQGIEAWAVCHLGDGVAFPKGGELLATLMVTDGDDVTTYTSVITEENYDVENNHLSFEFYDVVDGFEAAISPILNGEVILSITGFSTVNLGLVAAGMPDDLADYYTSSTFFVADMGQGLNPYRWTGLDAVVNLIGSYNFVGEYATGAHYLEGEIPAEGGWAVSAVVDGKEYNDFDIECVWGLDDLVFAEELPEWIAGLDYEEDLFEEYGVIPFYFGAEPLPEGVSGREGDIILETADGASRVTIHLVQGDPSASGIETIEAEKAGKKAAIYDLYGRQLQTAPQGQLFIQGGKILRK